MSGCKGQRMFYEGGKNVRLVAVEMGKKHGWSRDVSKTSQAGHSGSWF